MPTEKEFRLYVSETLDILAAVELATLTDDVIDDDLRANLASARIEGEALLGGEGE